MAGRARRTVLSALAHPLVMLLVFTAALLYVRPSLRDATPRMDSLAATLPAGQYEALFQSCESQRSALELLDAQIERAGGDPVLERQRDLLAEDVALLGRACEAEDARELLRAVATYDERLAERSQTAHNGAYLGAEAALYRALAELDDPRVIENSGEMPAVVYLATNQFALAPVVFAAANLGFTPNTTYVGSLEFLLWVVPLAAASFVGACLSERASAPARLRPGGARAVVVGAACGCAAAAAVALPAAVVAILRNGVGELAYPLAYLNGAGGSVVSSAGALLGQRALMLVASALFFSALAHLSLRLARRAAPGVLAAAGVVALAAQPWWFSRSNSLLDAACLVPVTYLDPFRVTGGGASILVSTPASLIPGAGAGVGVLVLGLSAVLVAAAPKLAAILASTTCRWRLVTACVLSSCLDGLFQARWCGFVAGLSRRVLTLLAGDPLAHGPPSRRPGLTCVGASQRGSSVRFPVRTRGSPT